MTKEAEIQENIPEKVIGVNEITDGLSATPSLTAKIDENTFDSEALSDTAHVNSYDVINDWEQLHSKRIKGKLRTVGEYVAKQNLSKKLPTTKEIRVHLGYQMSIAKRF